MEEKSLLDCQMGELFDGNVPEDIFKGLRGENRNMFQFLDPSSSDGYLLTTHDARLLDRIQSMQMGSQVELIKKVRDTMRMEGHEAMHIGVDWGHGFLRRLRFEMSNIELVNQHKFGQGHLKMSRF